MGPKSVTIGCLKDSPSYGQECGRWALLVNAFSGRRLWSSPSSWAWGAVPLKVEGGIP
jgi:hypothetical protein